MCTEMLIDGEEITRDECWCPLAECYEAERPERLVAGRLRLRLFCGSGPVASRCGFPAPYARLPPLHVAGGREGRRSRRCPRAGGDWRALAHGARSSSPSSA